jgi:hypothetical protein
MDVVSVGPLRVGSVLWQPRPRAFALTVACKATFHLAPGECSLASEQEDVNEHDNHWDDDDARSLYSASDLAPFKSRFEVLVVGHAFAPGGHPTRSLTARLAVGDVDKSIEVFCDRTISLDGVFREGTPFRRMSLRWERAAGGPDSSNPVGMRFDVRDPYGMLIVPHLQPPGLHVMGPDDRFDPVGFGPIAPSWPLRAARLGRFAGARLELHRQPIDELDASYFQAAPRDQQLDAFQGTERIALEHLHPSHPSLVTRLPALRPRAVAVGRTTTELTFAPDTLWIDTDRAIATLTWRARLDLESPLQAGTIAVAHETPSRRIDLADLASHAAQRTSARPAPRQDDATRLVASESAPIRARAGTMAQPPQPPQPGAGAWGLPFAPSAEPSPDTPRRSGASSLAGLRPDRPTPIATDDSEHTALDALRRSTVGPSAMPPRASTQLVPPALGSAPSLPAPPSPPSSANPSPAVPPALPAVPAMPAAPAMATAPAMPAFSPPPYVMVASPAPPTAPVAASPWAVGREPAERETVGTLAAQQAPPPPAAAPAPAPSSAVRPRPTELVDLLWHDPACVPTLRASERFRELIASLDPPSDDDADDDPFELAPPREPPLSDDQRARRDLFAVVARGLSTDGEELPQVVSEAVDDEGQFSPPLVVVAGELLLPFDELATLRATLAAVQPLSTGDKKLKETTDSVEELLKTPWLQSGASGVAEGLTGKLKEAFAQGNRMLPPSYLEQHTERALLEQRQYQKRTVFGGPWLRGLVTSSSAAPVPAYLPEKLATELPMFQRFRVRLLCEVHLQQDQFEAQPVALKVVALGRVSPLVRR